MSFAKTRRLAALGGVALLIAAGCTAAATPVPTTKPAAHWTYEGAEGPANWGKLDPAYAACADGSAQTPIDIAKPVSKDLANPVFAYKAGDAKITNNGHTIQAVAADGNTVTVDGNASTLAQMHFHAPSEHTIAGKAFEAEMHFVNKDAKGVLTVVGVMVEKGMSDNAAWAPFVTPLPTKQGTDGTAKLDWAAMLPTDLTTYRYDGSLTTPPCTEGVHWLLMTQPVQLSAAQLDKVKAAYDDNARPVQPLNGRTVTLDSSK